MDSSSESSSSSTEPVKSPDLALTPRKGRSHPAVRFGNNLIVPGELMRMNELRGEIMQGVVGATREEFGGRALDSLLSESLFSERARLRRERPNLFTRPRYVRDRELWRRIQSGLLQPSAMVDRGRLLDQVLHHYSNEIAGRFDTNVYKFATSSVPWFFSWLLNAASVRQFLPWKMTESLESRLTVVGEIPQIQNLAKKGTVLLLPTHQSNIDSVLVGYVIYLMGLPPFAYGAGLNLFSNPILSFFMSNLGAYTVDRKKTDPLYKACVKNYSTQLLRHNVHSIFFPGGGRARSGAIETRLKLGLLGTGLQSQIVNYRENRPNPNVYVVPMVMSYHFVLEAESLVEDFLLESGKHRYLRTRDESSQTLKVANFFWKLFSSKTGITVRVGRALDVFGNFVDDEGRSIGPNGTTIDPRAWLSSGGELRSDAQRDQEYTRELGERVVERYHRENTVLSSHLVAFTLFETLREQYRDLDLYRFLRLTLEQRSMLWPRFLESAERMHGRVRRLADAGKVHLSEELLDRPVEAWVRHGMRNLGVLHGGSVLGTDGASIWAENLALLYYYRNRLAGYGLSVLADQVERNASRAAHGRERLKDFDPKGFLA